MKSNWKSGELGHIEEHNEISRRLINVKDFLSVQDAINALPEAGGVIFFPVGIYQVESLLISKDNVTLLSYGAVIQGISVSQYLFYTLGYIDSNHKVNNLQVNGFILDGNNLVSIGVAIKNGDNCKIENCTIKNVLIGIKFDEDTNNCRAINNRIELTIDNPFGSVEYAIGIQSRSKIVDDYSGGRNDTLSFVEPTHISKGHQLSGNVIFNGTHGISLSGATDCRIINNHTINQTHRGIILSPRATHNLIENNECEDCYSTGIHLAYGSDHNIIIGNKTKNVISDYEGNGIKAYYACNHNLISTNFVSGTKFAGIRISIGCQNNTVINNKIHNCDTGIEIESYINANSDKYVGGITYEPMNPPANKNNVVKSNVISNCNRAIREAQRWIVLIIGLINQDNNFFDCVVGIEQINES